MLVRPWLAPFIIAFWCLTTGWLLVAKILPSLTPGSPPGYQALYTSGSRPIPVAWSVLLDERPLGWAASQAFPTDDGAMVVENRMQLDRISIDEILPQWTRGLLWPMMRSGDGGPLRPAAEAFPGPLPDDDRPFRERNFLSLKAEGNLSIDPEGRLRSFASRVALPNAPSAIRLNGTVDDGLVKIVVRAGEMRYEASRHLPSTIVLGDEFSPQATMPGLEPGKRWTVPTYNPLRLGGTPIEVLHAVVAGEKTLFWEDQLVRVNVVEYRGDPASHHPARTRLWVDKTGRVLRQDSLMLGSKLSFVRRSDAAAASLTGNLDDFSGFHD